MAKQTVPLYTVTSGDRVERARTSLAEALGGASLGDPNDAGIFDVSVDAQSPEEAREMVREAFARAGTGDDFVIQETTEGRELADDDPRQGDVAEAGAGSSAEAGAEAGASDEADAGDEAGSNGDRSSLVADAASAVAAAASDARSSGAADSAREAVRSAASSDAADSARAAASSVADAARDAASSVRDAVDEKGVGGAASDYASTATQAAQGRDWSRFAPIGGLLLLLMFLRRRRR